MKKIIIILILVSGKLNAQNLVLNPSFEDTIPCPSFTGLPQIQCSIWFSPNPASPDYFSETYYCLSNIAPDTSIGYQLGRTGIAYSGIQVYKAPYVLNPNGREYIEGVFGDTLQSGHNYCVSFYVSPPDKLKYLIDAIGAYISVDSVYDYSSDSVFSNYIPQINNPVGNVISDTVNWVQISGTYIAQGGEKYITIGNFKNNTNITLDSLNNNAPPYFAAAYYYIDDVSVIDCTVGLHEQSNNLYNINISPNPALEKTLYSITFSQTEKGEVNLQSSLGIVLTRTLLSGGHNTISFLTGKLPSGIYTVQTLINNKQVDIRKLAVVK